MTVIVSGSGDPLVSDLVLARSHWTRGGYIRNIQSNTRNDLEFCFKSYCGCGPRRTAPAARLPSLWHHSAQRGTWHQAAAVATDSTHTTNREEMYKERLEMAVVKQS